MRRNLIPLWPFALAALLAGCGSADDFQAGNRLIVQSVTDEGGAAGPIFNAVVRTDDSGRDDDATVVDSDGSQDDGFPDQGETVLELLHDDRAVITLRNEPRLGVSPGVDLHVFRVDFTYRDANGQERAFAPARSVFLTGTVSDGGTAELTGVLIPVEMKANPGGLQDIFLFGTPEEVDAVRQWLVFVDVYARDAKNEDTVHSQGLITVRFINPMVESVLQN